MEKGINSLGNINVIEGRNFTNDDFKSSINSPIPVLVGYKLIKYNVFKLGEEIEDKQNNRLYKVIGILSNDSTWFRFSPEQGEFMSLDDKLIIPFNDSMYSKILSGMMFTNYYSILKDEKSSDKDLLDLKNIADKIDLKVELHTLKEELGIQRDQIKKDNSLWILFSLFFIVMTSLSLLFIMFSSIIARKKEFGIRIAVGASLLQIQKLVIGEIIVIVTTASLIAIFYGIYSININGVSWYDSTLNTYYISPRIIIISIILSFIITIIPAIVASYNLKKIQPNKLIGGNY
jgi:putative ABC transport system permease protein